MTKNVTIYTDGGCEGNPGPGGWAAVLLSGVHRKEVSGGEPATTNNRMELLAAIEALRSCGVKGFVSVDAFWQARAHELSERPERRAVGGHRPIFCAV